MVLRTLCLAALMAAVACPAVARVAEPEPLVSAVPHGTAELTREPGDRCSAGRTDYYWSIGNWFTGNEVYAALGAPEDCATCGGGWQAIDVTIFLYWQCAGPCTLSAVASIREAVPSGDAFTPGAVMSQSAVTPIGSYSTPGLWAVTIPMPENTPSISEPFFATVEFLDSCGNLPRIVTTSGPCEAGRSWNDWGTGWKSTCDYGFPGDISMYATLQCLGPTPVESSTWTTIKAIYRNL